MVKGLISDSDYRKSADGLIASMQVLPMPPESGMYEKSALDEVKFAREMWEGAYEDALLTARKVADNAGGPELAGYRAWWWYLASTAADRLQKVDAAVDSLKRAIGVGINTAWLYRVLRKIQLEKNSTAIGDPRAEELWSAISNWDWTGPSFLLRMKEMTTWLESPAHLDVHRGLEVLGCCFGLKTLRPTTPGSPDVAWLDVNRGLAIEAKTEKKAEGVLYKKELQEAKGHPEWLRHYENLDPAFSIQIAIVSPTFTVDDAAKPFTSELHIVSLEAVQKLALAAVESVTQLRALFLGRDFFDVKDLFEKEMMSRDLTWKAIEDVFLSTELIHA